MQKIPPLPHHVGATCRGLILLAFLFQLLSSAALAQNTPKVLPPLDGDTDSVAMAINKLGETAGFSGGASPGNTDFGLRLVGDEPAAQAHH